MPAAEFSPKVSTSSTETSPLPPTVTCAGTHVSVSWLYHTHEPCAHGAEAGQLETENVVRPPALLGHSLDSGSAGAFAHSRSGRGLARALAATEMVQPERAQLLRGMVRGKPAPSHTRPSAPIPRAPSCPLALANQAQPALPLCETALINGGAAFSEWRR